MANKADFTAEEWTKILHGAMMAGMAVTAADPSGLWGLLKESIAGSRALIDGLTRPEANELIRAVVADLRTAAGQAAAREGLKARFSGSRPPEIKAKAIEALREVAGVVDAKAGGDGPGFKACLAHIAQQAAEAASEGGFLGLGGVKVSAAETATLADIAAALQIKAA